MSRLSLQLPETLHRQLAELAANESVSLNQYIIYALTRQVAWAYAAQALPEQALAEQRAAYDALLERLGEASDERIQKTLRARQPVQAERGLPAEAVAKLKRRMKGKS